MTGSVGAIEALLEIVPSLPANRPPAVVMLQIEPNLIPPFVERLRTVASARLRVHLGRKGGGIIHIENYTEALRVGSNRSVRYPG